MEVWSARAHSFRVARYDWKGIVDMQPCSKARMAPLHEALPQFPPWA